MNVRRSFLIALPLGLLLTAAAYLGLFFLQLGVPTPKWSWLHEIIQKKRGIAEAITTPKLIIVAGSSALFGINAEEIEKQTGFPTVNFAANAALGPTYTLYLTKQICRPGDVVLLAFEYEPYTFGDATGANTDELFIHYVLGHDREYVRGLDFKQQLKLALVTPGDRLWGGVQAVFRKPQPKPAATAFQDEMLGNISSHGDQIGAVPAKRAEIMPTRTLLSPVLAYGLPDSPPGFPAIREFCEWARKNDVRVLATFPNICHRPDYDLPAAQKAPAQLRRFFESIGVPLLGEVSESLLPEEQIFDTMYHPMRDAALARTKRLLLHLAPHLKPQPTAR